MASRLYTDTLQEGSRFTRVDKGTFALLLRQQAGCIMLSSNMNGVSQVRSTTREVRP